MISGDFRLLVGLGNPGSKYIGTRHNIGFMALEKLASKESVKFRQHNKLHGQLVEIGFGDTSRRLLKPNTYMNESGRSVRTTLDWFDLQANQILVIVDDMDLPLGRIRVRTNGSSGGHNGLRSIIHHLDTQDFCRLKIGIGAPASTQGERRKLSTSHVLGTFNSKETLLVEKVIEEVVVGLDLIQKIGLELASNRLNSYRPEDL